MPYLLGNYKVRVEFQFKCEQTTLLFTQLI
jgi:hypothetical protein